MDHKRPRSINITVILLFVSIILLYDGANKIVLANIVESIKDYFWGKSYPITQIEGRLLFRANRFGEIDQYGVANRELFMLDNGKLKKVSDRNIIEGHWSPDGKSIVCEAWVDEGKKRNKAIIIVDQDGSLISTVIKSDQYSFYSPKFFRNGKTIVFSSDYGSPNPKSGGVTNLFSIDKDGSNFKQLTNFKKDIQSVFGFDPSPAENKIVFTIRKDLTDYNNKVVLFVMDNEGGDIRQLTDNPDGDFDPKWSPDGENIAFMSGRGDDSYSQVYISDKQGQNIRRITNSAFPKRNPCWSPDGKQICYEGYRQSLSFAYSELFIVNIDGTGESLLLEPAKAGKVPATDDHPDWTW